MRRVDAALQQVLAEAVGRALADPRLEMVTITRVEATQDVREATVWYTSLGADPAPAGAALESARGVLQGRVAAELRTRHTPHLRFVYDRAQEDAVALTRLIDEVAPPADEG